MLSCAIHQRIQLICKNIQFLSCRLTFNCRRHFQIPTTSIAKQQCCYSINGSLITGLGGGHELRNVPDNEPTALAFAKEFTDNIAPFVNCCIISQTGYKTFALTRPSSDCSGYQVMPSSKKLLLVHLFIFNRFYVWRSTLTYT